MKLGFENIKFAMTTDSNSNRENEDVHASKESGEVNIGKIEIELTPEEVLEYIKTAPGVVKDALAFAKEALAMQRDIAKEESKKVMA